MKLFLLLIFMPIVAHAYIDPGSGSAIMTAIIGAIVAIGVTLKTYWYKIKSFFTGSKNSFEEEE